jgi:predicted ester cyclase
MSLDENKSVARRLFEAMSAGDVDGVDTLFTPDAVVHDPGRDYRGRDAIREGLRSLLAAFPDIAFSVDDQIAEGDRFASRYRGEGTHVGEWRGVPATGRRFSYTGVLGAGGCLGHPRAARRASARTLSRCASVLIELFVRDSPNSIHGPAVSMASSRGHATSRIGGAPTSRLDSRVSCDAASCPIAHGNPASR